MNETLNQKLWVRTQSALIFGAIVIGLLSFSKLSNYIFLALLAILSLWELYQLDKRLDQFQFNAWASSIFINLLLIPLFFWTEDYPFLYYLVLGISFIYSVLIITNLYFSLGLFDYKKSLVRHSSVYVCFPLIIAAFLLNSIADFDHRILKIIILIWTTDTAAYLVGSRLGKRKLFPSVSPNKTIEGTIGAGIFTLLAALVIAHFWADQNYFYWICLGLIVWIFGGYGDLVQSKIKRTLNIKDSGNIMPGHGGILDRFDSFLFVWPFIGILHLLLNL